MKKLSLSLIVILFFVSGNAQKKITTNGNDSSVIVGANAKVKYVTKQVVKNKIPDALAPYLVGLLLTNSQIGSGEKKSTML